MYCIPRRRALAASVVFSSFGPVRSTSATNQQSGVVGKKVHWYPRAAMHCQLIFIPPGRGAIYVGSLSDEILGEPLVK
jgi:hypothetical protein